MRREDSIRYGDTLDEVMQRDEDRHAVDQEQVDVVAERGSVQPWLVNSDDAERLLRCKVRELVADAYRNAA